MDAVDEVDLEVNIDKNAVLLVESLCKAVVCDTVYGGQDAASGGQAPEGAEP